MVPSAYLLINFSSLVFKQELRQEVLFLVPQLPLQLVQNLSLYESQKNCQVLAKFKFQDYIGNLSPLILSQFVLRNKENQINKLPLILKKIGMCM